VTLAAIPTLVWWNTKINNKNQKRRGEKANTEKMGLAENE
jgi:hypothetical protein